MMTPVKASDRFDLWRVPGALWAYGLFRALAFAAPAWNDGGSIGLGAIVVAIVYAFAVRGSRRALMALIALDTVSSIMLALTSITTGGVAIAIPLLTVVSLMCLLLPSTRRYVANPRSSTDQNGSPVGSSTLDTRPS